MQDAMDVFRAAVGKCLVRCDAGEPVHFYKTKEIVHLILKNDEAASKYAMDMETFNGAIQPKHPAFKAIESVFAQLSC
jgi:hypothetical protein